MGRKATYRRIHLIHFAPDTARSEIAALRSAGFSPTCTTFERQLVRRFVADPPTAIVIDLSRQPSAGRDIGVLLRRTKGTRQVPLVFAGGAPEKVARVRAVLSDAAFVTWDAIGPGLRRAIREAPAEPTIPGSGFAAYIDTPLLKKLGIEAGMTVGLIDAPENIERILGRLPKGTTLTAGTGQRDLILWFVTSRATLERHIEDVSHALVGSRLWIAWPKRASGRATDLTQAVVRRVGLANGLVDYKICAIDAVWSGLQFVLRHR